MSASARVYMCEYVGVCVYMRVVKFASVYEDK